MTAKSLKGRGRLVPTRPTGIAYQVRYGIPIVRKMVCSTAEACVQCGGRSAPVRLSDAGRVPDGSYFLYADDGKVHQLKSIDGTWHCLAAAA